MLTRRRFLQAGGATALTLALGSEVAARAVTTPPAGDGLDAIDHVVFLVLENRSFDHYFGTLRGVRGYDDRTGAPFAQPWPGGAGHVPANRLLPFHLDTSQPGGAWVNDITHSWGAQHACWNGGRMDQWAVVHTKEDGATIGTATMGYLTRQDLAFTYALADAFTICDAYHCSVMGPTFPNRLCSLTATIDPAGVAGGPAVDNSGAAGQYSWVTMPERLQASGVSWRVYQQPADGTNSIGDNVLWLFKDYQDATSALYRNAFLPTWPGQFEADVATGQLPQVSWILAPPGFDEHPPSPSAYGEALVAEAIRILTGNPDVWARTVLFITYDENGGFFDHLVPPAAPPGTTGEYLTTNPLPGAAGGVAGPVGLGFRVPMLVVSPFSRGGWAATDTFDHTSMLRFLETRFGVEVPNLSAWRRSVTGDLTSALNLARPDPTVPALPDAFGPAVQATVAGAGVLPAEVTGQATPTYPVPTHQSMPHQEPGSRGQRPRRPHR
jgi:phospholipase C